MQSVCKIILMVIITWLIAEAVKLITDASQKKQLKFRVLLGYGGFPSAHATFMTSLTSSIYLVDGWTTPLVIALALTILVIRDVIVMRKAIDTNTIAISKLTKMREYTLLSHSYTEITAGVILGIIGPLIINAFI